MHRSAAARSCDWSTHFPSRKCQLRGVGVDEYATRKSRHYGTVLVDVETRRPVDLLPDRESSSLAAWLAQRPGIEVVCGARAPFFAEGATVGAPQAVQVADRWHLWHNVSEAAERSVTQHHQCLRTHSAFVRSSRPMPDTTSRQCDSHMIRRAEPRGLSHGRRRK
ncbi:transposase [Streptomyces sp. NPDC046332]|uniref:transposase n=1 Tax=Streptomyces sp. NPDC046332 TaxID=3155133 RepID=UPI00340A4D8E